MKVTGEPFGVVAAVDVMARAVTTALVTVTLTAPDVTPAKAALTVVVPSASALATPVVGLMLATAGVADVQVTLLVIFAVLASE